MPAAARPMIGFGEVRHTRLRPARHAFAYAGYFLLLPMRSMQDPAHAASRSCLARNRRAALSFFDADHGDGRGPDTGGALAWLDALLHAQGITDADRRGLAAVLSAGARLRLQAGQLLVLPPPRRRRRRRAACHRGRGQQHLWRAPLLPARPAALGRAARCGQGCSMCRRSCRSRATTTSASCAPGVPTANAASPGSTTTTARVRCCRPVSAVRWSR